jgi:hypothetical protein
MAEPGLPGRTDPPRYTAGNLARESETRQGLADTHTGKLSADGTDSTKTLQSGDSFGMVVVQDLASSSGDDHGAQGLSVAVGVPEAVVVEVRVHVEPGAQPLADPIRPPAQVVVAV